MAVNHMAFFLATVLLACSALAANPPTDSVKIVPAAIVYGVEGGALKVHCERHFRLPDTEWVFPNQSTAVKQNRVHTTYVEHLIDESVKAHYLEINNLQASDSGTYQCRLRENPTIQDVVTIKIFGATETPPEPEISFADDSFYVGSNLSMTCFADKLYTLKWILHGHSSAESTDRLRQTNEVTDGQKQHTIIITKLNESDMGEYTCVATNELNQQSSNQTQIVDKIFKSPGVFLEDAFVLPGDIAEIKCTIVSDEVDVKWQYNHCDWAGLTDTADNTRCTEWLDMDNQTTPAEEYFANYQYSTLHFKPSSSGQVKCEANDDRSLSATANVYIQEMDRELVIEAPKNRIFSGNVTTLRCFASKYIFSDSIELYKDGEGQVRPEGNGIHIVRSDTEHMYGKTIEFDRISLQDGGIFKCAAKTFKGERREQMIAVDVFAFPQFSGAAVITEHSVEDVSSAIGTRLLLDCRTTGFPAPSIQWLKNNIVIAPEPYIVLNSTHLTIDRAIVEDNAQYECVAKNDLGQVSKQFNVFITEPGTSKLLLGLLVFVSLILVVLVVALLVFHRRKHTRHPVKQTGLLYSVANHSR